MLDFLYKEKTVINKNRFALNRMVYPLVSLEDFLALAGEAGINKIELRNDLEGKGIIDEFDTSDFLKIRNRYGISIETINAVQKFNLPSNFKNAYKEIENLVSLSEAIGCRAVVLCPNNDVKDKRSAEDFIRDTSEALSSYISLFKNSGITGLVEPLGFAECSVRSKEAAVKAIDASGGRGVYKIVHDTFHHYLGTDKTFYPEYTGLVHISGVEADVADSDMRDMHRVMISSADRISNIEQITELEKGGYKGVYAFEPFSSEIHNMKKFEILPAIENTINYIQGHK